ncbi:MAG: acyl CoA:acetate/3-ketoacid CoA transferase [Planctomycetes bacterium]|nr:acyl CoA:acetate/3-ketoacid CoA transferase [Planctomycetota bacterium]
MKTKVCTVEEAMNLIDNGDTLALIGNSPLTVPEKLLASLESRFLKVGVPNGLSVIYPIMVGWRKNTGLDHLGHEGMVKRVIGGAFIFRSWNPVTTEMIMGNKIEGYSFPIGVILQMLRAAAAGRVGFATKVGLETYIDPRQKGGKLNDLTKVDLVKLIRMDDEEFLFFKAFPIDVAFIRGTTADEYGNMSMEDEPHTIGALTLAMAAKASGGKVVAEVKRLARLGTVNPRDVVVPGILLDAIVVDPDQHMSESVEYCPSWTGEIAAPWDEAKSSVDLDAARMIILRRSFLEIKPGQTVSLGAGINSYIPQMVLRENMQNDVIFLTEHGPIGGIPAVYRLVFGVHFNPQAVWDSIDFFDYSEGIGSDIAFLSFAEVDSEGNVNVSRFGRTLTGGGGFMYLVHKAKTIVFSGTLTVRGLSAHVRDGRLLIEKEGATERFVSKVQETTFNGKQSIAKGQKVLYITERGVFELRKEGVTLVEIAPGVEQEDITNHMGFRPQIAKDVRLMDEAIFRFTDIDFM